MGPNKTSGKVIRKGNQKRMISFELKQEIIQKYEQGVRVSELARQYGRTTSTISTLLKQREAIKAVTPAKGVTLISKLRTSIHDEMERLLIVWIREKELNRDTLTQGVIREKALSIYYDLLKNTPSTSSDETTKDTFRASRGWFENFKKRTGIHSVIRHDETSEDYITFSELMKAKGCVPQKVFNCNETGLFWKKMPKRTYITAEKKTMPFEPDVQLEEVVSLDKSLGAEVNDCDGTDLVEEHSQELTEDSQELESQKQTVLQESAVEEPKLEVDISTSEIKDVLEMWEKVSQFVEAKHPEKDVTARATELFNESCLTYFRKILNETKKQTSLDGFSFKRPTGDNEENIKKKTKASKNKKNSSKLSTTKK